jgi:hypothetical protein
MRRHNATAVWLLLVAATGLSWAFSHPWGFGYLSRHAAEAVVLIAFIKVRYVFLDFMELRSAWRPLRLTFEIWTWTVCGTILVLYWIGK